MRILGIVFTDTTRLSATTSWNTVTQAIRRQAHDSYHRELALHLRIQYVNVYLLAKAWLLAQIFSPSASTVAQINTAVSWYLWEGSTFRVPLSALHRPKQKGGWQLIHLEAKCRALLYCRLQLMCTKVTTPTGRWLLPWGLPYNRANPPARDPRLHRFQYLQTTVIDSAYITPRPLIETARGYRRRVYNTLIILLRDSPSDRPLRVERLWPTVDWTQIWINLWQAPVDQDTTATWYKLIHDILPTRVRLQAINRTPDDLFLHCGMVDTLPHRLSAAMPLPNGNGHAPEWLSYSVPSPDGSLTPGCYTHNFDYGRHNVTG